MRAVGAVVLAAGGSSRMGAPKQLLRYRGETLLRRAVGACLGVGCAPVVVVVGAGADAMRRELEGLAVTLEENADWERGIGSSIRAGVGRLLALAPRSEGLALTLCDQPRVTAEVLQGLLHAFWMRRARVCVSSYAQTVGPPVVVGAELFPELLRLPDAHGAKSLWVSSREGAYRVDIDAGEDVDTPEDYARLLREG